MTSDICYLRNTERASRVVICNMVCTLTFQTISKLSPFKYDESSRLAVGCHSKDHRRRAGTYAADETGSFIIYYCFYVFHIMSKQQKHHFFQISHRWNTIASTETLPEVEQFSWKLDLLLQMNFSVCLPRKFRNCYGTDSWTEKDGNDQVPNFSRRQVK